MCSGVETIANFNYRPLYCLYEALWACHALISSTLYLGQSSVSLAMMGKNEAGSTNRVNYQHFTCTVGSHLQYPITALVLLPQQIAVQIYRPRGDG